MPLPPKLKELIDDLALYDRAERIEALIAIGEEFRNPGAEEVPRTEERRVPGCESEAFVDSEPAGAGRRFKIAVDNPQGISAMALARVIQTTLDGEPSSAVAQVPDEIVYDLFGRELSMGKSLGLMGMIRMVRAEAARS